MNNQEFLVDIPMCVYNHEKYIGQAIEGILNQKTDFKYRLLIGDDCSTDNSREVIKKYLPENSDIVKAFFYERNVGPEENTRILFNKCNAKYIALLDGDDYWTNPFKLQKQVDFLEANPGIFGCFHDVMVVDDTSQVIKENYYQPHKEIFNQADCVRYGAAYCTGALMFRSVALKNMPEWFLKSPSDYTIDLLITEFGDIAHLGENMGAYRIHKGGIWQGNSEHKNFEVVIKRYQVCLTNPKFRKEYGSYFYKSIGEMASSVALYYQREKKYLKKIKYTWYYIYYGRPNNIASFHFLIGILLFPSLYKTIRSLFSRPPKNGNAENKAKGL